MQLTCKRNLVGFLFIFILFMDWRVKLHRKILENPIASNWALIWFFCYLLLIVSHKENEFYLWMEKIIQKPWEWIISQKKLAKQFWVSIWTVSRWLGVLNAETIIETKWTNKYTVIKVLNRNKYQWDWKQTENKLKTDGKQTETINNDKNIKENINTAFEIFWKTYPHARKWKKKEARTFFEKQNVDDVMKEVNIIVWKIKIWLDNWKYIPACERWIRDFTPLADTIKSQTIKDIVYKLMTIKWDDRKELYNWLVKDFWKETIDKYVKQWNTEKNWITLTLK